MPHEWYVTRRKIYRYIVDYKLAHNGVSPTIKEIAEACFVSISTVKYHLLILERDGWILVTGRRAIEIPGSSWDLPGMDDSP